MTDSELLDLINSTQGNTVDLRQKILDQDKGFDASQSLSDIGRAGDLAKRNFMTEKLPTIPDAPSFTDIVGNLWRQKQATQGLNMFGSRQSTFATGPLGDTTPAAIGTKTPLGS